MSPPSPLHLDHIVLPVHDAAAARRFYGDVLGLPLAAALSGDDWGGRAWLMMVFGLGDGGRHLVATAFAGIDRLAPGPFPRDARHCAFAVDSEDDRQRWRGRLVDAKVEHWEEDHGDQRSLYFADPSGNVLEITTPPTASFATGRDCASALREARSSPEDEAAAVVERWIASGR